MWEILTGEDPYDGMHYGGVIGMLMLRWNLPSEQGRNTFVMSDLLDANLKYGLSKQLDVPQDTTTVFNV
jgi:tryptophanyl-tRNA synthetase